MSQDPASNLLAYDPDALARRLAEEPGSVLFLGPPGIGKSTLCRELGERLAAGGARTAGNNQRHDADNGRK